MISMHIILKGQDGYTLWLMQSKKTLWHNIVKFFFSVLLLVSISHTVYVCIYSSSLVIMSFQIMSLHSFLLIFVSCKLYDCFKEKWIPFALYLGLNSAAPLYIAVNQDQKTESAILFNPQLRYKLIPIYKILYIQH